MPSTVGGGSSAKRAEGSKGKKKAKKKDEEALRRAEEEVAEENEAEFQKALLEVRVNELETLNLGLKRKSEYLETQNGIYKTQIEDLRTEKAELVGYLERSWKEEKALVKHLEQRVNDLTETNLREGSAHEQKLLTKEIEFNEMKESLEKRNSDLLLQLTKIEEFRIERDDLMGKLNLLEKTLEKERRESAEKYEAVENELILYTEKIKKEAVEMLVQISRDVQKAGKLSLTGAVKAAIAANVELRAGLETVSKDNLALRDRLEASSLKLQKVQESAKNTERIKMTERRRCGQLTQILHRLLEKQCEMDQRIKEVDQVERELKQLKTTHALCQTESEIQEAIRCKTAELESENSRTKDSVKMIQSLESQLEKVQSIILNFAISSKEFTEAQNQEEFEFLSSRFKMMLGKVYEVACSIQHLSPEMKTQLTVSAPSVLNYFKV